MIFFYPRTVETRTSKINGEIKVTRLLGTYRLVIGGYTQSGGLLASIWGKALKPLKKEMTIASPKVLVLGLGAGTVAGIIHDYLPESEITGIEIDPVIIDVAKKYFKIDKIPDLKIITGDAIKWTLKNEKKKKDTFDLVIVDMYIGSRLPKEVKNSQFLSSLKNLASPGGILYFNQLIARGKKEDIKELRAVLDEIFSDVERVNTPANAVFKAIKS